MTSGWNESALTEQMTRDSGALANFALRSEERLRKYFGAIALSVAAVVVLAEWVPVLFGGLWLDETLTYWQAYRGWRNALALVSFSPGVSPWFAAVCSLFYFGPGKHLEFWLRLPAFLAMLAAAYFVFRLAEAWFGRNAAWLALVMFVSQKDIINRATEARPYGMALAACLGLMYGLHVWLSRGRFWGWLLFLVCTMLIPYWHFLFCAFLVTPVVYLACRRIQGYRIPRLALAGSAALIGTAWLPLRAQFSALLARGYTLSFAAVPNFDTFLEILLPERFVVSGFLALLAAQFLLERREPSFRPVASTPHEKDEKVFALVTVIWMFCGPVELFLASEWKGYGVLVERYVLYAVAGLVLYAAYFLSRLRTTTAQAGALAIFALVSLAGAANHHWRGPSMGSWREPSRAIARIDPAGKAPVIVSSGFVESNYLDWEHPGGWNNHLFAPLLVYPIANHWYPLPYKLDDPARNAANRLLDEELRGRSRIVLLAYQPSDLTDWLTAKLEERGYRMHSESPDSIVLLVFDTPVKPQASIHHRQRGLRASGTVRKVMLAGGSVIGPAGVETPVSSGRESFAPSFSSFPFSSTTVSSS